MHQRGPTRALYNAPDMKQLLYVSTATRPLVEDDLALLLEQSRHNNALFSVTGFLWSDGHRFMQVIEGPDASIAETYRRIADDDRHRDLRVLREDAIEDREFGDWSMAYRRSFETADEYGARVRRLLRRLSGPASSELDDLMGIDGDAENQG
jgi:hypothetical protein